MWPRSLAHRIMKTFRARLGFTGHLDVVHISYPEKLLATAHDLIDKSEFSIAVVVAHMACEISVERAMLRAYKAKSIEYLEQAIKGLWLGYNLNNKRVRNLYNAVTGDEIQK
jgi:hypothetical protein